MAAVHQAILTFARRLAHVETIDQQDSAERAFNKLARTFAPASVSVVASAMVKGTSRIRASVCASSVLPDPVGPISRMFDLASSTSSCLVLVMEALVVVMDGDREHLLGVVLPDDVVV